MADELGVTITDPHNVSVIFCNQVIGSGYLNGVCNVTMGTHRFTPTSDGKVAPDVIVAARLRLDMFAVQQLYDTLGSILEKNAPKKETEH